MSSTNECPRFATVTRLLPPLIKSSSMNLLFVALSCQLSQRELLIPIWQPTKSIPWSASCAISVKSSEELRTSNVSTLTCLLS